MSQGINLFHRLALARRCSSLADAKQATTALSFASLLLTVQEPPVTAQADGKELLKATAMTPGSDPMPITLLCPITSGCASNFRGVKTGGLVIVSGDPTLDDEGNGLILAIRSLSTGYEDQFLNEVSVTGRLSGTCKDAPQSASSSLAVNRFRGEEECTDWFRIRCFGANKPLLIAAPKGALVTASGVLEGRKSGEGTPFVEVKVRTLRFHSRPGGHNLAEGKSAAGYANSDFDGSDAPPMPTSW
jgi:hypothetical protein